jgi:hypothetical protein
MPKQVTIATVGHCIYCGKLGSDVKLTIEHIVPYALGGNYVLAEATCSCCQEVTKHFEQNVLRPMLGMARIRFKVQTRHKKDRELPFRVEFSRGDQSDIVYVHPSNLPAILALPQFDVPTYPVFDDTVAIRIINLWHFVCEENFDKKLQALGPIFGPGKIGLSTIPLDDFSRMLARSVTRQQWARPSAGPSNHYCRI